MPITVNGEALDDERIRQEERVLRMQLAKRMPNETPAALNAKAREWARDNVVDEVLLRQAVKDDPDLVKKLVSKLVPPKPKEITEYYKKNRAALYGPEMVTAVHVVAVIDEKTDEAAALARIQEAEKQLVAGADMASLEGYEDLSYFPRGRMAPEFDSVVFAMQPGDTSPVFRTRFGFHIARVLRRRAAGIPELNDIQDEIAMRLRLEKHRRAVDRHVDQLRTKASIQVE